MSSKDASSVNESATPGAKLEDKPSHDASVFVGSLPCNIDQGELTKLLMEHLAEYAEVKNIKVVRDSKGGICAFVQCESAEAASNLIHTLHAEEPKPFMGRLLRFEPARAFRTLLISYRAPSYAMTDPSLDCAHPTPPFHMLGLPTAMSISKSNTTRFHNIAYNADAVEAERHSRQSSLSQDDIASSLFLHPLQFDEDNIKTITRYFGRVEKLTRFQLNPAQSGKAGSYGEGQWKGYPPPHNSPRTRGMDTNCWEVKWVFRDDCVAALMALRRVPHLSVTWAHQPSYSGWENRYSNYNQHAFQPSYLPPPPLPLSAPFEVPFPASNFSAADHITQPKAPSERDGPTKSQSRGRNNGWDTRRPPVELLYLPNNDCQRTEAHPIPSSTTVSASSVGSPISCTDGNAEIPTQRSVDPTSIFVGGLEALSPSAWDEDKIRQHFGKYGGLQSVKFVKPFNGATGFAFLHFDNTDGPTRAVLEEHNRVYNGHMLRVKLRDCNPPRNPWKPGRGRGRTYHHQGHGHRKYNFGERFNPAQEHHLDAVGENRALSSQVFRPSSPNSHASTDGQTLHDEALSPSPSVTSSSAERNVREPAERYREWYDDLDASNGASTQPLSMPMFPPPYPYVFPSIPYYGPPPWVQPYLHHQVPCSMPYFNPYPMCPPIIHAPGHPTGDQDVTLPQAWPSQGVVYSSSYYAFPDVLRQQAVEQDYHTFSNPNMSTPGTIPVGQSDQGDQGANQLAISSKPSFPLEPSGLSSGLSRASQNTLPHQPQSSQHLFSQPSWNNEAPHMPAGTNVRGFRPQASFFQQTGFVAEQPHLNNPPRKRHQSSNRRDSQGNTFHGNRNAYPNRAAGVGATNEGRPTAAVPLNNMKKPTSSVAGRVV